MVLAIIHTIHIQQGLKAETELSSSQNSHRRKSGIWHLSYSNQLGMNRSAVPRFMPRRARSAKRGVITAKHDTVLYHDHASPGVKREACSARRFALGETPGATFRECAHRPDAGIRRAGPRPWCRILLGGPASRGGRAGEGPDGLGWTTMDQKKISICNFTKCEKKIRMGQAHYEAASSVPEKYEDDELKKNKR